MIRSIDLLFAIPEFQSVLRSLDGPKSSPFYSLLNLCKEHKLSRIPSNAYERYKSRLLEISKDELQLEEGRLYFLSFLRGGGFIAQKLLDVVDETFVLTFLSGGLVTKQNETEVYLISETEHFYSQVFQHFQRIVDHLYDEEEVIGTNNFIVFCLTNPERLFDIFLYESFIQKLGLRKSHITEHLIKAFKELKSIRANIEKCKEGQKDIHPAFGQLEALGLFLGFKCNLRFDMADAVLDTTLDIAYFLDMLYGNTIILSKQECFSSWLSTHGVDITRLRGLANYPNEVNLHYQKDSEKSDQENLEDLITYLSTRFSAFYDIAITLMDLLAASTLFDTDNKKDLLPWKGRPRLVLSSSDLPILPIFDAISDEMEVDGELIFRNPIVPWQSRMSMLGPDEKWPTVMLRRIDNVTREGRKIIIDTFFEFVRYSSDNSGYSRTYTPGIFILRNKEEMNKKIDGLSQEEKEELSGVDFRNYLEAMGGYESTTEGHEYFGVQGLLKAVQIHSLRHLRFGQYNRSAFTWPMYQANLLAH